MAEKIPLKKRLLLLVLDGIRPDVMRAAIREGDAPNFRTLAERGEVRYDAVSVFPSITPAATSAIATGKSPGESGIIGHAWFDRESNETIVYGAKTSTVIRTGAVQVFHNHVWRMNRDDLIPPTIYEELHGRGIDSATVHFPVRRGPYEHPVRSRLVENYVKGSRYLGQSVAGPKEMFLGDLFYSRDFGFSGRKQNGGARQKGGINDDYAAGVGVRLIAEDVAPFTLLYFFRGDQVAHHEGLAVQRRYLAKLDGFLGRLMEAAGGTESFFGKYAVLSLSDHGHAPLLAKRRYIALSRLKPTGRTISFGPKATLGYADTVVVPNGRAASYYLQNPKDVRKVAEFLTSQRGIDFAAWRDPDGAVKVRKHGREMSLRPDDADGLPDAYGGRWSLEGDPGIIGVQVSDEGAISYGDYPDALHRLWNCGLSGRGGDVIISAEQGHTFGEVTGGYHTASDHGALFYEDSLVYSMGVGVETPKRITDVTPTVLQYFDAGKEESG